MPVPGRRTVRRRTRPLIPAFLLLTGLLAAVVAVVPDRVARASAHATGVHLVALVANSNSNTVTPINVATDTPGSPIRVGSHPDAIAAAPDGKTVYVANSGSNSVTPIDLATKTPDAAIHICGGPNAIAITPDGTAAYVACYSATTPINLLTDKTGKAIHQGGYAIAISPDGAAVLIANQTNTALGGSLVGVDVATGKTIAAWGLAGSPDALAVAPDFSRVYVVLYGGGMYSIRWSTTLHSRFFETGGTNPDAIGVTGNGRTAYVANSYTNTVVPILLSTGKRGRAIPVGDDPSAIAIAAHRWTHPATQPPARSRSRARRSPSSRASSTPPGTVRPATGSGTPPTTAAAGRPSRPWGGLGAMPSPAKRPRSPSSTGTSTPPRPVRPAKDLVLLLQRDALVGPAHGDRELGQCASTARDRRSPSCSGSCTRDGPRPRRAGSPSRP